MILLVLPLLQACTSAEAQNIVLFGDSNTKGSNWQIRHYPENQKWAEQIASSYRGSYTIYNAGIGGETTEAARLRFEKDVLKRKPKYVFIMFGTNDAAILPSGEPRVSKHRFKENLEYFVEEVRKIDSQPILMTCLPIVEGNGQDLLYYSRYKKTDYESYGGARVWHNHYNNLTREIAERKGVPLIDNFHNMIQAAGEPTDAALLNSGLIDPSGNHMTPIGAKLIFEGIIAENIVNIKNQSE
nr:GDSL-type esterase/lipase family protein [Metabacillus arenae]